MNWKRILNPSTNLAGYTAAIAAVYAIVQAITNAQAHHTAINTAVIVAALTSFASVMQRQLSTPVKDPRDGNGAPLIPAAPRIQSSTITPSPTGTVPPATTTGPMA